MEIISARKRKSLRALLACSFFLLSSHLIWATVIPCRKAMQNEMENSAGSVEVPFLTLAVDAYGRNMPREAHETERAGQLYPIGEKFNSKVDANGNPRADGRYLFVVARDRHGNRRIMVVPRFEFEKTDGKILNTHRTMFRNYPDVFGPNPKVEVMGELELLNGVVLSYNNKAGTGFDPAEATQPELFNARKAIAENMGIDLSRSEHTVNYSVIAAAKSKEEAYLPGRHIEEEDYIKIAKLYHEHPQTKRLIERYNVLIRKIYDFYPEHAFAHPSNPVPTNVLIDAPVAMSKSDAAGFKIYLHSAQMDRPETVLARGLARESNGAAVFSKTVDQLEVIVKAEEAKRTGGVSPEKTDWTSYKGEHATRNAEAVASGQYDHINSETRRLLKFDEPKETFPDSFDWKVEPALRHYLDSDEKKDQLLSAQLLMGELRKRFGITQERDGPFDYKKFMETKLGEDDQFTDDAIARTMIYELFLESEKPSGNPLKLYDKMRIEAESAHEDHMYFNPHPNMVVKAYLRALGIIP